MSTQPRDAERGQLLDEVRDALAASVDQVDHRVARVAGRAAGSAARRPRRGRGSVRRSVRCPASRPDLGQERPQRMPSGQLVGPVGGDDHHRRVGQRPGQEAQQVPGRLVRPVDVLDDHHQRTAPLARSQSRATASNSCSRTDSPATRRAGPAPAAARPAPTGSAPAHSSTWSRPCRREQAHAAHRRSARTAGRRRPAARTVRGSPEPGGRPAVRRARATNASTTVVLPAPASPPINHEPAAVGDHLVQHLGAARAAGVAPADDAASVAGRPIGQP